MEEGKGEGEREGKDKLGLFIVRPNHKWLVSIKSETRITSGRTAPRVGQADAHPLSDGRRGACACDDGDNTSDIRVHTKHS